MIIKSLMDCRIYSLIEKILSKKTDCIITMNSEDYNAAMSLEFACDDIVNVNGVGIELDSFKAQSPVTEKARAEGWCGKSVLKKH